MQGCFFQWGWIGFVRWIRQGKAILLWVQPEGKTRMHWKNQEQAPQKRGWKDSLERSHKRKVLGGIFSSW